MENKPIIIDSNTALTSSFRSKRGFTIDAIIGGWLDSIKLKRSQSERTQTAYRDTLTSFRNMLLDNDLDLLSDDPGHSQVIADYAQRFAQIRSPHAHRNDQPARSTQNQRLAILSSFYHYTVKKGHVSSNTGNPIESIDRPTVKAYAQAKAISKDEIQLRLQTIDVATPKGLRDMAILIILLSTGRRVSEIAAMKREDIQRSGKQFIVTFGHAKGEKVMKDLLSMDASEYLNLWIQACYGPDFFTMPNDTPIWMNLTTRKGEALKYKGIAGVCLEYLGTTKVHTTRHSFALLMEEAGAKLTEIQKRLGHANPATTGIYMESLTGEHNAYAERVTALIHIKKGNK